MMTSRTLVAFLFALCLPAVALGQPAAQKNPSLAQKIETALDTPALRNASIGVCIRSLDDGNTIYARGADLALIPASNQKILTASAAIDALGTGFVYRTTLRSSGSIDAKGVLHGDLFVQGSGDPSTDDTQFSLLAKSLAASGIRTISGRIVADPMIFDDKALGEGWEWDDEPFDYAAQLSGLNCDENVVHITITPGTSPGAPTTVFINGRPPAEEPYVEIDNRVETVVGGTTHVSFARNRGTNHIIASGTISGTASFSDSVTIEQPALFAAEHLAIALRAAGIAIDSRNPLAIGITPAAAKTLATVDSKPLPELLKAFLKPSDNLYGEALLKTIGHAATPMSPGSASSGALAVAALLKRYDISSDGLEMEDGSGLTRRNTVTPRLLCALLVAVDRNFPPEKRDAFETALPIAGVDGTLRHRFAGTPLAGKVRGKTGTLAGVSTLSGYLTTTHGKRFAFSILMNNFARDGGGAAAHAAQDRIIEALNE